MQYLNSWVVECLIHNTEIIRSNTNAGNFLAAGKILSFLCLYLPTVCITKKTLQVVCKNGSMHSWVFLLYKIPSPGLTPFCWKKNWEKLTLTRDKINSDNKPVK